MRLVELALKNWCQHENLRVQFRPGLNGILGRNGRGKSNLLDGLRFVFTGESVNSGNKRDNLRWGQDSGWVQVTFEVGDTLYTLRRSIESSRVELKWGQEKLTKDAEVERELTRLLANPKTLHDNVFIPQGKIDQILEARPSDRLKNFQEAFGLDRAADVHRLLTVEINGAKVTPGLEAQTLQSIDFLKESRAAQAAFQETIRSIREVIATLEPAEKVIKDYQEATAISRMVLQADQNLAAAQTNLQTREAALAEAVAKRDPIKTMLESITPQAKPLLDELTQLEQQEVLYGRVQSVREDLVGIEQALTDLAAKNPNVVVELDALRTQVRDLLAEVQRIRAAAEESGPTSGPEAELMSSLREKEHQLKTIETSFRAQEIFTTEHTIATLKKELGSFESGTCPTCGQAVHDGPEGALRRKTQIETLQATIRSILADRKAQAKVVQDEIDLIKGKIKEIRDLVQAGLQAKAQEATRLAGEIQQREQVLKVFEGLVKRRDAAKAALSVAPPEPPSKDRMATIRAFREQMNATQQELGRLEGQVLMAHHEVSVARQQVDQAMTIRTNLKQSGNVPTPEQLKVAEEQVRQLSDRRAALAQALQDLGIEQAKLKQRELEVDRLKAIMAAEAKTAAWIEQAKKVRDVLHVTQLPALVMREFARVINGQIEYYLNTWEAGYRMWLDDSLAFRVKFDDGKELEASRLSGGQKVVAATSFRLAMSDTFARKVGLLVLDEPSNHLDRENIQHLQALLLHLKTMSVHSGRQILIVTHEESLMGFLDHSVEIK